jgi:hypothetical protein
MLISVCKEEQMSTKPNTVSTEAPATRSRRLIAVASAVVAAVAGWVSIEGIGGVDLHAPAFDATTATPDIGLGAVVFASLVASLAAWALLAVLERYSSRPRRIWTILVVAGLVVSLGGPMSGGGIDTANRALLALLHVIVAAVLIPLLYRIARVDGKA